jgi:hypothetical protein
VIAEFRLAENGGAGGNWNPRTPGLPAPFGGGSSGRKQEYNFSILVSVAPARGQLHRFQARGR